MKLSHLTLSALSMLTTVPAFDDANAGDTEHTDSYRARCAAFWTWFGEHADDHRTALLAGDAAKIDALKRAFQSRLDELVPGLRFGADLGATPDSVRIDLQPGRDRTRQLAADRGSCISQFYWAFWTGQVTGGQAGG